MRTNPRREPKADRDLEATLRAQLDAARQEVAELRARLRAAETELAEAREELKQARLPQQATPPTATQSDPAPRPECRSAAPFRREKRVSAPKKRGRPEGIGKFSRRQDPEQYSRHIHVEAPSHCPHCQEKWEPSGTEIVTTTHVPKPPPEVTAFHVPVGRCPHCHTAVRGEHPELPADQRGATAHRLGTDVVALAAWLRYHQGITERKVPAVLDELLGIKVTQSALSQAFLTTAERLKGTVYETLRKLVKDSPYIHTDDTSWRIGGAGAFLMIFISSRVVVFQIRSRHGNQEVQEIVPVDFTGSLITDRGPSYDAGDYDHLNKQKCLSHLLSNVKEALRGNAGPTGEVFLKRLRRWLKLAIRLSKHSSPESDPHYLARAALIMQEFTKFLTEAADGPTMGPSAERILKALRWHHARGSILRFLMEPGIAPTNNAAERGLRPAVIARKTSQCSKNQRGADAHAIFMSIISTLKMYTPDILANLNRVLTTKTLDLANLEAERVKWLPPQLALPATTG